MHYHNRISDKEYNLLKINLKANLVDPKERQIGTDNSDSEYDSYVNFVKSELMNNKNSRIKT